MAALAGFRTKRQHGPASYSDGDCCAIDLGHGLCVRQSRAGLFPADLADGVPFSGHGSRICWSGVDRRATTPSERLCAAVHGHERRVAFCWAIFGQVMICKLGDVVGFTLITWVAVFATPQLFVASAIFDTNQIELIMNANWIVWGTSSIWA